MTTRIWEIWGQATIDLMATELTHRLPTYISPYPDPHAYAVDAMSCEWTGMDAYIFPPWAMLNEVLNKVAREECVVTLIAPRWPNRPWFPVLLGLLVDVPVALPPRPDLLTMPHNDRLYPGIPSLDLHACRLSSLPPMIEDFQSTCRGVSPQDNCAPQHSSYESKWSKFAIWCQQREMDPEQAPVSSVCDFLLHLFEQEGLAPPPSTVIDPR